MHSFQTPSAVTLRVSLPKGKLRLIAEDRDTTSIELTPHAGDNEAEAAIARAEVSQDGDVITVVLPREDRWLGWGRGGQVEAVIRVPRQSRGDLRTESASVECEGALADVTARSGSGRLTLAEAVSLDATTGSGAIQAGKLSGGADLRTGSGRISLDEAGGDVAVSSGSGAVHLGAIAGEIRATTASGEITVDKAGASTRLNSASGRIVVRQVSLGRLKAGTASGQVDVSVSEAVTVWLDVHTVSGRVESDLEATQAPQDGADYLHLAVRTVSGRVRLRRLSVAVAA